MIANFHFIRPLWLLTFIPTLLLWLSIRKRQDDYREWSKLISTHLLKHLIVKPKENSQITPLYIIAIMWVLSIVALSGPSFRNEPSPFADDQAGLFIILKVTPSMMAKDIQPTRLERAKQKIYDLLAVRKNTANGLIVYSGTSHLVMPLTKDSRIIKTMLEGITPDTMPKDGDSLFAALNMANNFFERMEMAGSILVIADKISPAQIEKTKTYNQTAPVQFLSVNAPGTIIDNSIKSVAETINARITHLSIDDSDVDTIAKHTERNLNTIAENKNGTRPKDSGYLLLPLILLCALFWTRKGWRIE